MKFCLIALALITCPQSGCETLWCEESASQTATLMAQLSFWNPSEEELPLQLMQSYVKGMNCGSGTKRAYDVMNERIVTWLQRQP